MTTVGASLSSAVDDEFDLIILDTDLKAIFRSTSDWFAMKREMLGAEGPVPELVSGLPKQTPRAMIFSANSDGAVSLRA